MSTALETSRYEILGPLGSGGFGRVYKARVVAGPDVGRMVALKMATNDNSHIEGEISRLRDEARILEMLEHPSIVKAERLDRLKGAWTIVMEYVEGASLRDVVRSGPIPPGVALDIVAQVATALQYAYNTRGSNARRLRLIHRDIKPSNILVTAEGHVKVLDFGIASANFDEREGLDLDGNYGSAEYMSPERLVAADGPAGDVYSMGLVLYELITAEGFGRTSPARNKHDVKRDAALTLLRMVLGDDDEYDGVVDLFGDMTTFNARRRPKLEELAPRIEKVRADFERETALRGKDLEFDSLADWAPQAIPLFLEEQLASSSAAIEDDTLIGRVVDGDSDPDSSDEPFLLANEPPSGEAMFALASEGDSAIPSLGDGLSGDYPILDGVELESDHDFGEPDSDHAMPSEPSIIDTSSLPDPTSMKAVNYWDAAANAEDLFGGDDPTDDLVSADPTARLPSFEGLADEPSELPGTSTVGKTMASPTGRSGVPMLMVGVPLLLITAAIGAFVLWG